MSEIFEKGNDLIFIFIFIFLNNGYENLANVVFFFIYFY